MKPTILLTLLAPSVCLGASVSLSNRQSQVITSGDGVDTTNHCADEWVQCAKTLGSPFNQWLTTLVSHYFSKYGISQSMLNAGVTNITIPPGTSVGNASLVGPLYTDTLRRLAELARSEDVMYETVRDAVEYWSSTLMKKKRQQTELEVSEKVAQIFETGLKWGMITSIGRFDPGARNMSAIVNGTALYVIIWEELNIPLAGVAFLGQRINTASLDLNFTLYGIKPMWNQTDDKLMQYLPGELPTSILDFPQAIYYSLYPNQWNGKEELVQGNPVDTIDNIGLVCGDKGCYYQIEGPLTGDGHRPYVMVPASPNTTNSIHVK